MPLVPRYLADQRSNATRISALKKNLHTCSSLCPGGTYDNSPTLQRWVGNSPGMSPEGTAERGARFSRPFGTLVLLNSPNPTLKRWAIIKYPSGINRKSQ